MIISHYKETFEVIIDYPTIGEEDINITLIRQLRIFYIQIFMSILEG